MARLLDEFYSIAVAHGYTGEKPDTINGVIDAITDTLAGEDVDSGKTVSEAVRALAPHIGSSGGGVELGPLQNGIRITSTIPAVGGDDESWYVEIKSAKAGNTVVFGSGSEVDAIAAGLVVTIKTESYGRQSPDIRAYVVTSEVVEGSLSPVYTSARQWDGQLDVNVGEEDSDGYCDVEVTLTMPELDVDGGETLVIYKHDDLG